MKKILITILITLSLPIHHASAFSTFNDPGFTLNSQDSDKQWGIPATGFIDAWDIESGRSETVVAVIDTGVDGTHEDLRDVHFVEGYDFIKNKVLTGKEDSDDHGHGTLIAGIISATANNNIGIVGLARGVSIMPLKALSSDATASSSIIAKAIRYAAERHVDVINLSLGGVGEVSDPELSSAIETAYKSGVVIVAAAGNDYQQTGGVNLDNKPVYPICTDNGYNMVIGVTAIDKSYVKPDFANYGKQCIDIAAPGKRILSTINHDPITKAKKANSYAYVSGTSIAAPYVSALAALIKSHYPYATNVQVREQILKNAKKVIDAQNLGGCDGHCAGKLGVGLLNAKDALATEIVRQEFKEGDLIMDAETQMIYVSTFGKRRPVSDFVLQTRYKGVIPKVLESEKVRVLELGSYMEPADGTLVKSNNAATVYYVLKSTLRPVTLEMFKLRKLSFASVNTIPSAQLAEWKIGSMLPPPDGYVLQVKGYKGLYLVMDEVVRPVTKRYYDQRGLQYLPKATLQVSQVKKLTFGTPLE